MGLYWDDPTWHWDDMIVWDQPPDVVISPGADVVYVNTWDRGGELA